jgi:hypothetical protein
MKENLISTPIQSGRLKDLKTGVKVTAVVGKSLFEVVKPALKFETQHQTEKFIRVISRK